MAANVVFEVAPRFVELARGFDGVDHVITWGKDAPSELPEWDVQVEVMELPYMFRTLARDLPLAERYLRLPTEAVTDVAKRMGNAGAAENWLGVECGRVERVPLCSLSLARPDSRPGRCRILESGGRERAKHRIASGAAGG